MRVWVSCWGINRLPETSIPSPSTTPAHDSSSRHTTAVDKSQQLCIIAISRVVNPQSADSSYHTSQSWVSLAAVYLGQHRSSTALSLLLSYTHVSKPGQPSSGYRSYTVLLHNYTTPCYPLVSYLV
jgi:hypothetical protein